MLTEAQVRIAVANGITFLNCTREPRTACSPRRFIATGWAYPVFRRSESGVKAGGYPATHVLLTWTWMQGNRCKLAVRDGRAEVAARTRRESLGIGLRAKQPIDVSRQWARPSAENAHPRSTTALGRSRR
jgi:hypothetical protein